MKRIALLFPGQGAQYSGMGHDFFREFPSARHIFEEADDLLRTNLSETIFSGTTEDLKRTSISQLAIFVTSIAILSTVPHIKPYVALGLSLGEYSALTAEGRLTFTEALTFVQSRAEAMERACEDAKGTMAVILGLPDDKVSAICKQIPHVYAANFNCPNQIVISGSVEAVQSASEACLKAGAKRALSLQVAGAFHSPFMKHAEDHVSELLKMLPFKPSSIAHITNSTGILLTDNEEIRTKLYHQITSPVLWHKSILTCEENSVDLYIEIGPGKTLSGLNRRIQNKETLTLDKVEDIKTVELALT